MLINLLKAKKDPTVQKLIVVTDLKQIEQFRKRIADMPESFRESLKFWQDTSVEQAHSNLEELIDIIRALGLVE